jgi:hypothetical protein
MATLNCRAHIFQAVPTAITIPQSSFWAEPEVERCQSMNVNLTTRLNGSRTTDGTATHDTIVIGVSFLD